MRDSDKYVPEHIPTNEERRKLFSSNSLGDYTASGVVGAAGVGRVNSEERSSTHTPIESVDGALAAKKGQVRTPLSEAALSKSSSSSVFYKRGTKIDPKKIIIKAGQRVGFFSKFRYSDGSEEREVSVHTREGADSLPRGAMLASEEEKKKGEAERAPIAKPFLKVVGRTRDRGRNAWNANGALDSKAGLDAVKRKVYECIEGMKKKLAHSEHQGRKEAKMLKERIRDLEEELVTLKEFYGFP